jgi:hypothetical protein
LSNYIRERLSWDILSAALVHTPVLKMVEHDYYEITKTLVLKYSGAERSVGRYYRQLIQDKSSEDFICCNVGKDETRWILVHISSRWRKEKRRKSCF